MAEGATTAPPPERDDSISAQLRRRRLGQSPTISEHDGNWQRGRPSPVLQTRVPRRKTSFMTESSMEDVRSSTDDLLSPRPATDGDDDEFHQEPSIWYSLPLLFAIVPAIGGVVFKSGSVFITDLALLTIAAIYLNWCLVTPWVWYHSARTIKLESTALSADYERAGNERQKDPDVEESPHDTKSSPSEGHNDDAAEEPSSVEHESRHEALQELQVHELFALALCFAGPFLGACVLHVIRDKLSHSVDELVSNMHLTLFVLGAELRPLRHALKMVQKRTLHLQKIVREETSSNAKSSERTDFSDLTQRLNDLEASHAESKATKQAVPDHTAFSEITDSMKKQQAVMQAQIDALNRAVRRYEKRATAQSIQTEGRLNGLEDRLKDALSLAAVAANYSQKPGLIYAALQGLSRAFQIPLQTTSSTILYPARLALDTLISILTRLRLVRPMKRKRVSQRQQPLIQQGRPLRDRASFKPWRQQG